MIFTESTIKISNNVSKMDSTIVLYRGDKNVEIRFTILQSPFKYSNTVATNVIESTNASYGQLVIKTPNDKPPIFSEVSATKEGTVLFTITKEMIDEIEELGVYTFQIRLMDENKQSRVTIPPVENGIEIKEPIAIEDDNTTNVVGLAKANYAVATSSDVDTPAFDDNGKYIKTNWNDGDIITNASLNKIEDGIYTTNENVTATKKYVDDNAVILPLPIHTTLESTSVAMNIVNIMDLIPGVQYSTHNDPNETKKQGYRVVYICDDGNFKTICNMPLPNKVVHLLKVLHYTNYSILSVNNTVYKVDYSKHSIVDDVQITKTLQDYLPITNTIEYNPTKDYHPATKKYVDDRFICSDLVENVGTITKEEMQKCNNGTSRYVSSINLKEFFADYKYCAYQGMYGDKSVRMIYDPQYNRVIAYDLDTIDTYDITLGFEFNSNYMYPFNGGASQVKSYQFTNDLVITKNIILNPSEVLTKNNTHEYTPTNDYNPATKKYVDDIKTGIDGIKADLGTAQLTTNAKDVKGAVNEVNAQCKDIETNKADKNDLDYINVLDLGIKAEANFDNTSLLEDAINKGIKNFYFPSGIYELNLIISSSYIRIKGDGIDKTIFNPHVDNDVINIQYVDNAISNCMIRDIEIKNKEFTNNNGLSISGNDKGVNAVNDNHYFKNLKISNFLNGIFIKDRTICSKFENIEVSRNHNNGIRVDSISKPTCFNSNSFCNIIMTNNINEGLYINTTCNSSNSDSIALVNNFIGCDIENNANSDNTTRFYGIYITDVDNINFQGCYIENNAQNADNGINLCFNGNFCRGLNINGTLIWGSKYALKVTNKSILSGEISSSNKINGIIDITDTAHDNESGLVIGCAIMGDHDKVKKLDETLLKNTTTTLNPFSIGIIHDHSSTPSVKKCNYITTFSSHEITNFTDGILGQIVIVRPYGDATLTFNNGTYIQLKDNNTCTITVNQTITFMKYGDKWVELFRNV